MAPSTIGMLLFLASEAVFFVFLIIGFVYLRSPNVRRASTALDPAVTGVYTAILIASSVTMWLAGRGARVRKVWLAASVVLGALFLVGQGREYARLLADRVTVSRDVFGTTFYTLTGIHGLHVATGIFMMLVVGLVSWRSPKPEADRLALENVAWYWHLVDGVWIVIFTVVYLGGRFVT